VAAVTSTSRIAGVMHPPRRLVDVHMPPHSLSSFYLVVEPSFLDLIVGASTDHGPLLKIAGDVVQRSILDLFRHRQRMNHCLGEGLTALSRRLGVAAA
jgi:hypothetical protein